MAATAARRSATSSPFSHFRLFFFTHRRIWNNTTGCRFAPPINLGAVFLLNGYAYVVERFRKYHKTLTDPGFHFLIPLVDRVTHVYPTDRTRLVRNDLHFTPADQSFVVTLPYIMAYQCVDPMLAYWGVKNGAREISIAMDDKLTSEILSNFNTANRLLRDADRRLLAETAMRAANTETVNLGVKCAHCTIAARTQSLLQVMMNERIVSGTTPHLLPLIQVLLFALKFYKTFINYVLHLISTVLLCILNMAQTPNELLAKQLSVLSIFEGGQQLGRMSGVSVYNISNYRNLRLSFQKGGRSLN